MSSASYYKEQVQSLDIENNLNKKVTTIGEAKQLISECRNYQKELRLIKKNITLDIKVIRSEYSEKIASAGQLVGGAFSIFGKRRIGGSIRADSKRSTTRERNAIIAPYEEIKLAIDNFINGIDEIKGQLDSYIHKSKPETENTKQSSSRLYCSSCGNDVSLAAKFCSKCGSPIEK